MEYFGDDGDRMHMMFNFQVNQHLFYALAAADTRPLVKALKATKPRPATAQWGIFLRNHDELDLGRLTKQQRQAVFDAFGPGQGHAALRPRHPPPARADARRRSPPPRARLQPDVHAAGHAGHPLRRRDRHGRRPAPARAQLRAHADAVVDRAARRLHEERQAGRARDRSAARTATSRSTPRSSGAIPNSLLNWTERIIRMRKEVPEIGWGDFEVLDTRRPAVLAMRYDWRNNSVLFVHNLDSKPREITFSVGLEGRCGQRPGQSADRRSQPGRRQRAPPPAARALRLPLVSRRRPRLPAEAQRHRHRAAAAGPQSTLKLVADSSAAAVEGYIVVASATAGPQSTLNTRLLLRHPGSGGPGAAFH